MYSTIKRAVIEVEGSCNYRCSMCPQTLGRGEFNQSMNLSTFKRLIDECSGLGLEVVQLDGSGEATLNRDLPAYIQYCTDKGVKAQIFSNGSKMSGSFMRECVDAGLALFRFSVNGYDRQSYRKVTGLDNFDLIIRNYKAMKEYISQSSTPTRLMSYHLILEDVQEVHLYRANFINVVGGDAEIWKQHNWAGVMNIDVRKGPKNTCGRPFAPEITIRAGGIDGHRLAVTPCCQTSGHDEDAVLAHCDESSVLEAFNSERYNWLREKHHNKEFDEISFCKNCDFLYDDESVLVWSNTSSKQNKMLGLGFELERG